MMEFERVELVSAGGVPAVVYGDRDDEKITATAAAIAAILAGETGDVIVFTEPARLDRWARVANAKIRWSFVATPLKPSGLSAIAQRQAAVARAHYEYGTRPGAPQPRNDRGLAPPATVIVFDTDLELALDSSRARGHSAVVASFLQGAAGNNLGAVFIGEAIGEGPRLVPIRADTRHTAVLPTVDVARWQLSQSSRLRAMFAIEDVLGFTSWLGAIEAETGPIGGAGIYAAVALRAGAKASPALVLW